MSINSEIIRKKYKYRKLVLEGKINLPLWALKKLIGPDTAYHLYSARDKKRGNDKPSSSKLFDRE